MITFKKIDVYGQIMITAIAITIIIISLEVMLTLLLYCFVIGCWQVISALVHLGFRKSVFTIKERRVYLLSVIFFFISLLVLNSTGIGGKYSVWLLFSAAPLIAIWYLSISFRELTIWEKRRLIQLK